MLMQTYKKKRIFKVPRTKQGVFVLGFISTTWNITKSLAISDILQYLCNPKTRKVYHLQHHKTASALDATASHRGTSLPDATSPDGGIGRRAGLKHQWSNPCRFDPGSGYQTKCKCLFFKHLHFYFCFLHHGCTTEWAVLGQKLCFSKKISVGPVSFVCLGAKLVKVGVNRKNIKTQHEDISLLILLSGSLLILLFSIIQTNLRLFSHTYNIF